MTFDSPHLHKLYINGRWVSPVGGGREHKIVNPADGTISGSILFGDEIDAINAIESARRAFDTYSKTSVKERIALLIRVADVYERRLGEMAYAITQEMGAPLHSLSQTLQAPSGLVHLQRTAEVAKAHLLDAQLSYTSIVKDPIGVCSIITPWNSPMNQVACRVAPALVAGCTIVLKPSQNAPLSAVLFAEILHEAGVPAGVFNMIHGEGERLGEILSSHPLVDMVSLAGSTATGAKVSRAAADTMKRASLEIGGRSTNIILDGANLGVAVTHGVFFMTKNSGQTCTAPSRMLVPADRLSQVEEIAASACEQIVVGAPMTPDTTMGPIANRRQFQKVRGMIQLGLDEGAKLVSGGLDKLAGLDTGFYVAPTVFVAPSNQLRIARDEIFGPVLTILPYHDEDEAVAIANDSAYGLSGYVFGADTADTKRVARRLRMGMVHLNGAPSNPAASFGGYKQSGNGREWGGANIDEFLTIKSIFGVD